MNNLMSLQDKFQSYLLHSDDKIEKMIVGTENVPVELRLMIYGNAYRARLLEALSSTYSVLYAYLGEDDFNQLGSEYIDAHPSTFRSIRWFGDQLPAFLMNHNQYFKYPYLSELATIEWTMALVFDAADCPVSNTEEINHLSAEAWNNLQIHFHPSVHTVSLSWNGFEIWQAISDEEAPPLPVCSKAPVSWVLWRNELLNHFASVREDEAFAINMINKGQPFGMLCEELCQWSDEENAVMRAASLLKGWVLAGMVKKTNGEVKHE